MRNAGGCPKIGQPFSYAGRAYVTSVGKAAAKKQLNNSTVLYRALEYTATYNDNDRGSDKGKVTFTRPVSLKTYAQSKGFKVTVKGNRYTLKKGKDTFVLKNKAKSVYKNGEYTDDLIYPVYKVGKTVYASVKNCSQKVSIESPIMIRRPVVQGFL